VAKTLERSYGLMASMLNRLFTFQYHTQTTAHGRRLGLWRGLCLGDRNGGPTQMAKRLKESLEDLGRFCAEDIFSRYYQWWCQEGFDTGPTVEGVFQLVRSGLTPEEATRTIYNEIGTESAGCNPAHRSAPLAMMDFLPVEELAHIARKEARLTHLHPESAEAAAAVVILCRKLIDGVSWGRALQATAVEVEGASQAALIEPDKQPLDRGGQASEVLRAAVSIISAHRDFDSALEASLKFAGPANYSPVLVGSIAGARWG